MTKDNEMQGVISYLNSTDYQRRMRREDQQLFTQVELATRGKFDPDYSGQWMEQLQTRMGAEAFAIWLTTQQPPLEERTDADIRAALFAKLQDVLTRAG